MDARMAVELLILPQIIAAVLPALRARIIVVACRIAAALLPSKAHLLTSSVLQRTLVHAFRR